MSLSKAEETVLKYLWELGQGRMKDLIHAYGDSKPAPTTLATLLKRMKDKGYIDYRQEGKIRKYYPLVNREDYLSGSFKGFVKKFFGSSNAQFASFFARSTDMSSAQLEELKSIIDEELQKKK